jgi:ribosomal protein L11 methyltransferase
MPWLQLHIQTEQQYVESLSDLLSKLGALSVTYQDAADQPLFEPPPGETPLWSDTLLTGLFDTNQDLDHIAAQIRHQASNQITAMRSEILEDKDWVREWMDNYHPLQFGDSLWIVPSHRAPPDPAATNILLDPGLAFGTGTHPTTAMCLTWLAGQDLRGQRVIDYGCGSGILAIAAAKLGADDIIAIDNDPQALLATQANAEKNTVTDYISCQGVQTPIDGECDLLLANILAGPLIQLAPLFASLVKTGGQLVLSGILPEQAEAVASAYLPWFDFEPTYQSDDWVRLSAQRNPQPPD